MTLRRFTQRTFLLSGLICLLAACRSGDEQRPAEIQPTISHKLVEKKVVVSPDVARVWKAVRISVIDKSRATENTYTMPINGVYRVPSSSLTISVEAFLPAFVMEGNTITSLSNEPTNPGVKVHITDNGVTVFKGWLFSKFPNAHAVTHPTYGFALIGAVPASK